MPQYKEWSSQSTSEENYEQCCCQFVAVCVVKWKVPSRNSTMLMSTTSPDGWSNKIPCKLFRTPNPNTGAAIDPRLRPRGHSDRQTFVTAPVYFKGTKFWTAGTSEAGTGVSLIKLPITPALSHRTPPSVETSLNKFCVQGSDKADSRLVQEVQSSASNIRCLVCGRQFHIRSGEKEATFIEVYGLPACKFLDSGLRLGRERCISPSLQLVLEE